MAIKFSTKDSLSSERELVVGNKKYQYFDLTVAAKQLGFDPDKLPISMKVVFENLLRFEDGTTVTEDDLRAVADWLKNKASNHEIAYRPARVLMQDFTGVPAVVDLAAMRDAMKTRGGDLNRINPLIAVDLVIDHSVQVYSYANPHALADNVKIEMRQNAERYKFLRWGQGAFNNFRVVPPGTGICHQVNLEYLAKVVWTYGSNGQTYAYPDTLVGTDSHTTMINGLAVLGWGVGGIEAEAAMLGQPISMLLPEVVGCHVTGKPKEGVTATDIVLTATQMLRRHGVVNKFVEFYGAGLSNMSLADRATIANMAPEYGATCGFFPVDDETIKYLKMSGREADTVALVEAYSKKQGMWRDDSRQMHFSSTIELDLGAIVPSLAGPKRPQDRVALQDVMTNFVENLPSMNQDTGNVGKKYAVAGHNFQLTNGNVVIAAITSCTNTSNPFVMLGAGLLAKKAVEKGLISKPWVKTSLAPGSKVVTEYLAHADLQQYLDKLGFEIVGYGCTTCIGNSGPLKEEIDQTIRDHKLVVAAVLSGNRNFEGRIHPSVRANYLASPPLCVAYALAGTVEIDLTKDPIGNDKQGNPVYLKDIWPSSQEITECIAKSVKPEMFASKYAEVFKGDEEWRKIEVASGMNYGWEPHSTYIKKPPFFEDADIASNKARDIAKARVLAVFGDSITTDHISPAGSIAKNSPAAKYLQGLGVEIADFNSYGARRGNHEVMMRGTFANTRIKNELLGGLEGGYAKVQGTDEPVSIYDAAMHYKEKGTPLVIFAGKEYGTGSSRDWAAKGTNLLGVVAVVAESFERIHRSNLVGMGVIPLVFKNGMTRADLKLDGSEEIQLVGLEGLSPLKDVQCIISRNGNMLHDFQLTARVDTAVEVEYVKHGGILQYTLHN
ncbi:MAG: aconitate hydratase AcnA [Proteobacteria bacterium]|nr:aconitate hydratase AcnA [Pseudomonadota bacterium]